MSENEKDQLRSTQYDGIQEYDNDLPKWWQATFYATLIFGFFYWMFHYTFDEGRSQNEILTKQIQAYEKQQESNSPSPESMDFYAMAQDHTVVDEGKKVFATYCQSCHGEHAQGLIGPNLTDEYWIHGGKPTQMIHVIENGVIEKGMTPWKGVLSSSKIHQVVAYVISMQGSNPSNPKEPQGDKFVRE
ncbi:MAG: cbb3-type cytochrome c oxidase N-terminal domain-containing protein [Bdellovibrionota bacterium]